jgi:hypothetical protein
MKVSYASLALCFRSYQSRQELADTARNATIKDKLRRHFINIFCP